jgi:hypothetical protein
LRQCRDFNPAYDTLLFLARRLCREDPLTARELLLNLERAAPQRQDAGKLRESLLENYGKGSQAITHAR